jgi:hypothetical protein
METWVKNARINIFTGHFGSGKSEVAVNYALRLSEMGKKTVIADLDIVNPFFRTKDTENYLKSKGIKMISTLYANTNVDVPAVPAEVNMVFENNEVHAVLDIGGDEEGARVVSCFKNNLIRTGYNMFFVINTKRLLTDTPDKIIDMIRDIEKSAGISVSAIVNNTNLLEDTKVECVLEGEELIGEVSKRFGLPVAFTSGIKSVTDSLRGRTGTQLFTIERRLRLPWDKL